VVDYYTLLVITAIIGLCYGSFINVLIYRIPNNLSIIKPRSFCPDCNTSIPIFRNIPIISFVLQLGKCHSCHNKIALQYPAIEMLTGILWVCLMLNYGQTDLFNIITSIIIVSLLIPLAIIDLKHLYFPLSLLALLIIVGIILACYSKDSLIGMGTGLSFLVLIYAMVTLWFKIKKRKDIPLGFGDILLIIPLGAWLGPLGILLCFFVSSLAALLIWIILYLIKGFNFNEKMPFGPYLIGSSILIKLVSLDQLILVLIFQIR